jgi:hypothetical protein
MSWGFARSTQRVRPDLFPQKGNGRFVRPFLLSSTRRCAYAAKAPRIFFIAFASSWRMRSADTP